MPTQKPLRPAVPLAFGTLSAVPTVSEIAYTSTEKKRRYRHTLEAWEQQRVLFTELYYKKEQRLENVIETITRERGFEASIRQWRKKIKEWDLERNFKASDMRILVAKKEKRKRHRGVETVFCYQGKNIETERIDRFIKREGAIIGNQPSPSTATPFGFTYYTPQANIEPEALLDGTNDVLTSETMHLYQSSTAVTGVKVRAENLSLSKAQRRYRAEHKHIRCEQGIICCGRFSAEYTASEFLWQAHNLAVASDPFTKKSASPLISHIHRHTSDAYSAPQYWIGGSASRHISESRIQYLLHYLKQPKLSKTLFNLKGRDRLLWMEEWRLMTDAEGLKVDALARRLFGDLSLPYPEMNILTLYVKLHTTSISTTQKLLRLSFGTIPTQATQDCNYCHTTIMLLDFLDHSGAVKIHIPLPPSYRRLFSDLQKYTEVFTCKSHVEEAKWAELTYLFQGLSQFPGICSSPRLDGTHGSRDEDWNSGNDLLQNEMFEPFPLDRKWHICMASYPKEKWVEAVSDASDDGAEFESFPRSEEIFMVV